MFGVRSTTHTYPLICVISKCMPHSMHTPTPAPDVIRVTKLHVYPLKGAAGFSPQHWPVDERGLRHDRRFMLVDETGNFISQRTCAKLALVRAEIISNELHISYPARARTRPKSEESARRTHDVAQRKKLQIPLEMLAILTPALWHNSIRVQVWDDFLEVPALWPEVDAAMSEFLGQACRLVYMPDNTIRLTSTSRGEPRRNLSFADAAPLLLTSESSLEDLNARLQKSGSTAIPMDRFRANIVIQGAALAADDHWSALTIHNTKFRASNSCKRCKVITIDQATGEFHSRDPILTLATYRGDGTSVTFGQHLLVERAGTISVGDIITVNACAR
jgi:uncharacterized protein YcbX